MALVGGLPARAKRDRKRGEWVSGLAVKLWTTGDSKVKAWCEAWYRIIQEMGAPDGSISRTVDARGADVIPKSLLNPILYQLCFHNEARLASLSLVIPDGNRQAAIDAFYKVDAMALLLDGYSMSGRPIPSIVKELDAVGFSQTSGPIASYLVGGVASVVSGDYQSAWLSLNMISLELMNKLSGGLGLGDNPDGLLKVPYMHHHRTTRGSDSIIQWESKKKNCTEILLGVDVKTAMVGGNPVYTVTPASDPKLYLDYARISGTANLTCKYQDDPIAFQSLVTFMSVLLALAAFALAYNSKDVVKKITGAGKSAIQIIKESVSVPADAGRIIRELRCDYGDRPRINTREDYLRVLAWPDVLVNYDVAKSFRENLDAHFNINTVERVDPLERINAVGRTTFRGWYVEGGVIRVDKDKCVWHVKRGSQPEQMLPDSLHTIGEMSRTPVFKKGATPTNASFRTSDNIANIKSQIGDSFHVEADNDSLTVYILDDSLLGTDLKYYATDDRFWTRSRELQLEDNTVVLGKDDGIVPGKEYVISVGDKEKNITVKSTVLPPPVDPPLDPGLSTAEFTDVSEIKGKLKRAVEKARELLIPNGKELELQFQVLQEGLENVEEQLEAKEGLSKTEVEAMIKSISNSTLKDVVAAFYKHETTLGTLAEKSADALRKAQERGLEALETAHTEANKQLSATRKTYRNLLTQQQQSQRSAMSQLREEGIAALQDVFKADLQGFEALAKKHAETSTQALVDLAGVANNNMDAAFFRGESGINTTQTTAVDAIKGVEGESGVAIQTIANDAMTALDKRDEAFRVLEENAKKSNENSANSLEALKTEALTDLRTQRGAFETLEQNAKASSDAATESLKNVETSALENLEKQNSTFEGKLDQKMEKMIDLAEKLQRYSLFRTASRRNALALDDLRDV